jgi:hypothetical protein
MIGRLVAAVVFNGGSNDRRRRGCNARERGVDHADRGGEFDGVDPQTWLADLLARIADHAFPSDQPTLVSARRRRLRFDHIAIPGGTKCQRVVMGLLATAVAVSNPEEWSRRPSASRQTEKRVAVA